MRFLILSAALLLCAPAWGAGPRLVGGDLALPLPSGWVAWTDDEIELANPTVPEGQTILAQGAAHRFGYPGFNSTLTLSRLNALGRQIDVHSTAERLLRQMTSQAGGFQSAGSGVEDIALPEAACAVWRGVLPIDAGGVAVDVHITQAVIGTDAGLFLMTGLLASQEQDLDLEWILDHMTMGGERTLRPGMLGPPSLERALWGVSGFKFPVPDGWSVWTRTSADAATVEASAVRSGIARVRPSPAGFSPTMAIESSLRTDPALSPLAECRRTSEQLQGMLSEGAWLREPETLRIRGHEAAWAWLGGVIPVHRTIVPIQLCDLWIMDGEQAIRLVAIMEQGDQETLDTLESLLNLVDENGM